MPLTDNEYLDQMYANYKPTLCHCGEPDSVFHQGRCAEHAEQELSDALDKGVGRGRPHGGAVAGE